MLAAGHGAHRLCLHARDRVFGHGRHLITAKRIESRPIFARLRLPPSFTIRLTSSSTSSTSMASPESLAQVLKSLSITPTTSVSHGETTSPAAWREALQATQQAPKDFELIKTLVFKPKTAKSATPIPVVVIARDETETNSGALGKKLNLKELRLASEDLLSEFFSLNKDSRKILLLSMHDQIL